MYNLKLKCSTFGSYMVSSIIGILVVAVVAPSVNVALYLPEVKSAPSVKQICYVLNNVHNIVQIQTE